MKKKYNLLILLTFFYLVCFICIMSLLNDKNLQLKLVFFITGLYFYIFSRLLKATGNVYWLTAFNYEDYKKMSSNEQFNMASQYAKSIAIPNCLLCIYQLISVCFHLNMLIDIVIFIVCILSMCFSLRKK